MSNSGPLAGRTIGDYLEALGSSRPDPGGGSVAGLIGSLAAALGQMVISLSIKNSTNPGLELTFTQLGQSISALLDAAASDEQAYSGYVDASRMPKSTDEEKAARRLAMQAALINAAEVPLRLSTSAVEVLHHLDIVVAEGTAHALSDADIAVSLAHASVMAGLVNVRINVPLIKDAVVAGDLASRADRIEQEASAATVALRAVLEQRRHS